MLQKVDGWQTGPPSKFGGFYFRMEFVYSRRATQLGKFVWLNGRWATQLGKFVWLNGRRATQLSNQRGIKKHLHMYRNDVVDEHENEAQHPWKN